jgi:NADH:ubiquinone oxidoreductase subunit 6 (subunit J)
MELLELKSVWDTVINETTKKEQLTEFEVANTIKKDSKNALSKIKRVMYFKFIIGSLTLSISLLMLIGTFVIPEKVNFFEEFFNINENRIFLSSIIIFIGFMLSANYKPFIEIKQFNRSSENIKNSLKRFIVIMEKTIKINIYSGAIINSTLFTWVFYAVAFKTEPFSWNLKGFIFIAVPFITFSLFYLLGKYEQKIKFGNHLKKLKSCLKEIEEK